MLDVVVIADTSEKMITELDTERATGTKKKNFQLIVVACGE
jgi:hypothetical protein